MTRRLETVLATVDWAHCVLRVTGATSGYALDGDRSGLFARYLRGDNSPRLFEVIYRDAPMPGNGTAIRFFHPIYVVLGRSPSDGDLNYALITASRRVHTRVFDTSGALLPGNALRPATSRRLLDLAVQGDGFALATLIAYFFKAARMAEPALALEAGLRAWQCLLLAVAGGEFAAIGRLLAARLRQQVLNQAVHQGETWDTATPDLQVVLPALRRAVPGLASAAGASRRRLLREVLVSPSGEVRALLVPDLVSVAEAERRRQEHVRALDLDGPPRGRFQEMPRLGAKARAIARAAFHPDWVEP